MRCYQVDPSAQSKGDGDVRSDSSTPYCQLYGFGCAALALGRARERCFRSMSTSDVFIEICECQHCTSHALSVRYLWRRAGAGVVSMHASRAAIISSTLGLSRFGRWAVPTALLLPLGAPLRRRLLVVVEAAAPPLALAAALSSDACCHLLHGGGIELTLVCREYTSSTGGATARDLRAPRA